MRDKKNILNFFVLFSIYSLLYFEQIFIANSSISLASTFETDPGSILDSIYKMFNSPVYSNFNGYHSKYYGWTFNSICFFLTSPLIIANKFFIFDVEKYFIFEIRLIHHLIGFFTLYNFNLLLKECNTDRFLALLLTISIIFSPASKFFYFIHPETTGILFIILSVRYFLKTKSSDKISNLYLSIIFLVLASLSKQLFAIYVFFIFTYFYIYYYSYLKLRFYKESSNLHMNLMVFLVILITSLVVVPYVFIQPAKFILIQLNLGVSFYQNISFVDNFFSWMKLLLKSNFIVTNIFLNLLLLFLLKLSKPKELNHFYFLALSTICYFFIIIFLNRGNISLVYLYLLNFVLLFAFVFTQFISFKRLFVALIIISHIGLIVTEYPKLKYKLDQRLDFNNSLAAISYQYLDNLDNDGLIVFHDQFVAVPKKHISCHFWKDCNNLDYVSSIEPDYIIYAENYKIGWAKYNNQPRRIHEYIKESGSYHLLTTLSGSRGSIIDDNFDHLKLYVYKKI
jgi:hypothetical protein